MDGCDWTGLLLKVSFSGSCLVCCPLFTDEGDTLCGLANSATMLMHHSPALQSTQFVASRTIQRASACEDCALACSCLTADDARWNAAPTPDRSATSLTHKCATHALPRYSFQGTRRDGELTGILTTEMRWIDGRSVRVCIQGMKEVVKP